jgi:hypothetical protein
MTALLIAWVSRQVFGQSSNMSAPISDARIELNQTAMAQIAAGKLREAELEPFRINGRQGRRPT